MKENERERERKKEMYERKRPAATAAATAIQIICKLIINLPSSKKSCWGDHIIKKCWPMPRPERCRKVSRVPDKDRVRNVSSARFRGVATRDSTRLAAPREIDEHTETLKNLPKIGDRDPGPRYYWQSIGVDGQVSRFLPAAFRSSSFFYPSLQMTWKNAEEEEEEEEEEKKEGAE